MTTIGKLRFTIIEANSNIILSRDLVVREPEVIIYLSSPSRSTFKVPQGEQYNSSYGIDWKTWGYWIIPEIEINGVRKCLGAQIVNKCDIDYKSGDMVIEGIGFMGYPKGIPWLTNYMPIAVDPAEVIQQIWSDCQSYTNANLGVTVLPALTGVEILPGYSFDGSSLSFDFYAMFIKEVDFQDSGGVMTSLARDTPLDMIEEVSWNTGNNTVNKVLRLGYPKLGAEQQSLSFVLGENVINAELAEELEIEPVSDVIIRSWMPGKTKTAHLIIDPPNTNRFRRIIMEEDAYIDSTERAAAWANKKLIRRNIPISFSKIFVDASHPNAPLGSYDIGDTIYVEGKNYPWRGDIAEWHRITSITYKNDDPIVEIGLKVEGAFNYDPIEYDPNYAEPLKPTDLNLLSNGYFSNNVTGWVTIHGQWFRATQEGRTDAGSLRVDCDDYIPSLGYNAEIIESHKVSINPGSTYNISAWVKRQSIVSQAGANNAVDGIWLKVQPYQKGSAQFALAPETYAIGGVKRVAGLANPEGTVTWTELKGSYVAPSNADQISVSLCVTRVSSGITWWDDVKVLKA